MSGRVAKDVERVGILRVTGREELDLLAVLERKPQVARRPVHAREHRLLREPRADRARGVETRSRRRSARARRNRGGRPSPRVRIGRACSGMLHRVHPGYLGRRRRAPRSSSCCCSLARRSTGTGRTILPTSGSCSARRRGDGARLRVTPRRAGGATHGSFSSRSRSSRARPSWACMRSRRRAFCSARTQASSSRPRSDSPLAALFAAASAAELRTDRADAVVRRATSCSEASARSWRSGPPSRSRSFRRWTTRRRRAARRLAARARRGRRALYGLAALGFARLHRRRRQRFVLAFALAFALLAEAMVVIAWARNWQVSWWEWHVLMLGPSS